MQKMQAKSPEMRAATVSATTTQRSLKRQYPFAAEVVSTVNARLLPSRVSENFSIEDY